MSDFDKEAERERLREKYERDEQKREVTEKMSELLLKGATMTNAHCQDCGDPIFRYDGQEFCPTCEKAVQRDTGGEDGETADDQADETAASTANGDQEEIEVATPDETPVQFGGDTAAPDESRSPDGSPDETPAQSAPEGPGTTADAEPAPSTGKPPDRPAPARSDDSPAVEAPNAGSLGAAKGSLSRTVTQLARKAEATDDLDRTRALLAATTEAAEALAAVREADR